MKNKSYNLLRVYIKTDIDSATSVAVISYKLIIKQIKITTQI